jgi:hypothetical protein
MILWGPMVDSISSVHSEHLDSALKHYCNVLSIDSMFLTGKYEVTMLIVITIVEKENSGS